MFMIDFEYYAPLSLKEALSLLIEMKADKYEEVREKVNVILGNTSLTNQESK